ncbi:MAG: exosome complex protein Rrp42 [Candidatus Jordarchaeales archaeon]
MHDVLSEIERRFIISLANKGRRADGRTLREMRPITIETELIKKAEGSAKVSLGETKVIAGVKAEIGAPFPDEPNKGVITCNAELIPLASPLFEAGPPQEDAIELARVVDRGIRETEMVDMEKLCIIPGEKVWILFIDLYILDDNGNLFDAASYAAVAALLSTRIPKVEVKNGEVKRLDDKELLPIRDLPVSLTFSKIGEHILLDPMLDEERAMECRLTIVTDKEGRVVAVQKSEDGVLSEKDINEALEIAIEKGKEIREKYFMPLLKNRGS